MELMYRIAHLFNCHRGNYTYEQTKVQGESKPSELDVLLLLPVHWVAMHTLLYLAKLFSFLFAGMLLARVVGRDRFVRITSLMRSIVLWALLFFMGVNTGGIPNIMQEMSSIGALAFFSAVVAMLGTFVLAYPLGWFVSRADPASSVAPVTQRRDGGGLRMVWDILKEPLVLVGIVAMGLLLRLRTPLFDWFDPSLVTYLLYGLLMFVGMSMVQQRVDFKGMFSTPVVLLLPVCTILGSWLGALVLPLFTECTVKQSLGLVSGFGWYTLSGVLISDLGYPLLGSVSFLSNLFRESLTFFLVPLFARLGERYLFPSICIAGATSMDVTLALIAGTFHVGCVGAAVYHGFVISLSVPLLIPLFF
jgi:uncharacterized membrane protein YbjE (DUF340 family)